MTENKRFTFADGFRIVAIRENGEIMNSKEVCNKLNELYEENNEFKINEEFKNKAYSDLLDNFTQLKKKYQKSKKENKELKSILQDMGLIVSNEEVKNVRDEIASKLIKPLCKGNEFDVDVNTENGFTIIPKGVNNDRE